ncbi:MAG: sulfite exporter TauE/SafE family protein [Nocardioidaceae bacterium]
MIGDITTWNLVALAVALFIGATAQGVVGLGVGLLFAPIAGLLEPSLLPGVALYLAAIYPVFTLTRDVRHVDWRGLGWALPARVPGTAVGVAIVALVSDRFIAIGVGVMVLVAVALTVRTVTVPVNRGTLAVTGFVSGVTGTATSIGGPPMALLYQRREPDQSRATLGVYFLVGAILSLVGLALTGQLQARDGVIALALSPVLVLAFLLSGLLRRRVRASTVRAAMLSICAIGAAVLVVRNVI